MLRQLAWDGKFWRKELSDCPEVTQNTLLISILAFEKVVGKLRQAPGAGFPEAAWCSALPRALGWV